MLRVSLTAWPVASRLLGMLSRRSPARTSYSTQSTDTFTPALPTWAQAWGLLFMLTSRAGPRKVSLPWRRVAKSLRFSPVEPEENLAAMTDSPTIFQTSTDWATPKLSWSRPWLMESTPCSRRTLSSKRSIAFKLSQIQPTFPHIFVKQS